MNNFITLSADQFQQLISAWSGGGHRQTLPARGASQAPKFDDKAANLEHYFEDLEHLFGTCNVEYAYECKQAAVQYLDSEIARIWRGVQAFESVQYNWDAYKNAIRKLYPGAGKTRAISQAEVHAFTAKNRELAYPDQEGLSAYYQKMLEWTSSLMELDRMDKREQSKAFLEGLHPTLLRQVMTRIDVRNPNRHPDEYVSLGGIYEDAMTSVQGGETRITSYPVSTPIFGITPAPPVVPVTSVPMVNTQYLVPEQTGSTLATTGHGHSAGIPISQLTAIMDTFSEKLAERISANRAPMQPVRDRPPHLDPCTFCGQRGHMARFCQQSAQYVADGKCIKDGTRHYLANGDPIIKRAGETYQQAIDRLTTPVRTSAIVEIVSPQVQAEERTRAVHTTSRTLEYPRPYATTMEEVPDVDGPFSSLTVEDLTSLSDAQFDDLVAKAAMAGLKKGKQVAFETTRPWTRGAAKAAQASSSGPQQTTDSQQPPRQPTPGPAQHPTPALKDPSSSTIVPALRPPASKPFSKDKDADFHYQAPIQDAQIASDLFNRILDTEIKVKAREIAAVSPDVRKHFREATTTKKVAIRAAAFVETLRTGVDRCLEVSAMNMNVVVAAESESLRTITPRVNGDHPVQSILDPGCQIVAMSKAVWNALKMSLNPNYRISVQSANGTKDPSLGLVENLPFTFGGITVLFQVHVLENPAYDILLGRPFDVVCQTMIKNFANGDTHITITDLNNPRNSATFPTEVRGPIAFRSEEVRQGFC